ncbi:hypothetical protein H0G86_009157 [Trichoderma simmonsii]|uniref:Uncharacterized protein n=1 Tax=Trichoderma simmonsii TaxID=1491479 RepID=A0A8G0PK18_9HYPO|nr:hypothetical protein H0G86_009157 [Trichoderma simmonsii]
MTSRLVIMKWKINIATYLLIIMVNNSAYPKRSTSVQPAKERATIDLFWQDLKNGMAVLAIKTSPTQSNQPATQNGQAERLDDQQARLNDQPQPADRQSGWNSQKFASGNLQNTDDPRAAIENNVVKGEKARQDNQAYGSRSRINGNQAHGGGTEQANTAAADATTYAFSKVNNWLIASLLLFILLQVIIVSIVFIIIPKVLNQLHIFE